MSKNFKRYNSHKLKRISPSWRRQRGLHNKVRLGFVGYTKKPKIGYGSKDSGQKIILIATEKDLTAAAKMKDNKAVLLFSSTLGMRKKVQLAKKAAELKLKIQNVVDDYASIVEKRLSERKTAKEERKKKKESKQKELDKKAKEKKEEDKKTEEAEKSETKPEDATDKDKKDTEKKEQDKLLIRKEGI